MASSDAFDAVTWAAMAGRSGTPQSASMTMATASPALIDAIIHVESGGNPNAVSAAGARGLMQLEPATARSVGVTDPSNPHQNRAGGTAYINQLLKRYNGNVQSALAAYNMGPTAFDRVVAAHGAEWAQHVPTETQAYVPRVLAAMENPASSAPAQSSSAPAADPWAAMAGMPNAPAQAAQAPSGPARVYPSDAISRTPLTVPTMAPTPWYDNLLLGAAQGASALGHRFVVDPAASVLGTAGHVVADVLPHAWRPAVRNVADAIADGARYQGRAARAGYNALTQGSKAAVIGKGLTEAAMTTPFIGAATEGLGALPFVPSVAGALATVDPETNALKSAFPLGKYAYQAAEGATQGALASAFFRRPGEGAWTNLGENALLGGVAAPVLTPAVAALARTPYWLAQAATGLANAVRGAPEAVPDALDEALDASTGGDAGKTHPFFKLAAKGGREALAKGAKAYGVDPSRLTGPHLALLRDMALHNGAPDGTPVDPEILARTANLLQHGFQPTLGSATGDSNFQATEDMLRSANPGHPLQARYQLNNLNAHAQLQALRDEAALGGPGVPLTEHETAKSIIDAVKQAWHSTQDDVGKLYDQVAEQHGDEPGSNTAHLLDTLDQYQGINAWDELANATKNKMLRWKLLTKDEDGNVVPAVDEDGNPKPLTVGQHTELRKYIQSLGKLTPTAREGVRQLLEAHDQDFLDLADPEAQADVKAARAAAAARFRTFLDGGALQDIVNNKVTPETLMPKLLGIGKGAASVEGLRNLTAQLGRTEDGQAALAALRGAAGESIQKAANALPLTSGVLSPTTATQVSPAGMSRQLTRLEPKMESLFGEDLADRYRSLGQAVRDTFTPSAGTPINYSRTAATMSRLADRGAMGLLLHHPLTGAVALAKGVVDASRESQLTNKLLQPVAQEAGNRLWNAWVNDPAVRALVPSVLAERNAQSPSNAQLAQSAGASYGQK